MKRRANRVRTDTARQHQDPLRTSGTPITSQVLPYGRQSIDAEDISAVADVLRSDWLTTGPTVRNLEQSIESRFGAQHAVAVSSGTAALHLAAMALGLGPGDKVVVPTITFLSTANAIRFAGADVVFCDVDPDSGLMRPSDLHKAIDEHPAGSIKAVFPVHLAGQVCDMPGIAAIGRQLELHIVEDACHAIGGDYHDGPEVLPVGSCRHSDMAAFSLHPVKTITMGEGGLVCTNRADLNRALLHLRNHGMVRDPEGFENKELAFDETGSPNPWYYEMSALGYNYRASDLHCALGSSQLGKLDGFVHERRQLAERYNQLLTDLTPLVRPITRQSGRPPAWHLYVVLIDFEAAALSRAAIMKRMLNYGIATQVHYVPVHRQPYYSNLYGARQLPGAERYYGRCLSLPLHPSMTDHDVDRVVEALTLSLDLGQG